jgi:hypothetical protein
MRSRDLLEHLRRRPFRRFRLILTDGRAFEVRHPELAMVGSSTVTIALAQPRDPEPMHDRLITVPLVEVLRVEPTGSSPAPSA